MVNSTIYSLDFQIWTVTFVSWTISGVYPRNKLTSDDTVRSGKLRAKSIHQTFAPSIVFEVISRISLTN